MGFSRFARRYSGNRIFFLFLQVLRCFSSPRLSSIRYEFTYGYYAIKHSGFPHSEIPGSKLTYSSPRHIGVSAVLHRLLVPRHPPCALNNLTFSFRSTSQYCVSFFRSFSHVQKYAPSFTQLLPCLARISKPFTASNTHRMTASASFAPSVTYSGTLLPSLNRFLVLLVS